MGSEPENGGLEFGEEDVDQNELQLIQLLIKAQVIIT